MPSGSGSFEGHAIPATVFFCSGALALLITLKRFRNLNGETAFCDAHIPEKNPLILHRVGVVFMTASFLNAVIEGLGGVRANFGFFFQLAHQALYMSFFFVGMVSFMEARKLLPPDSIRVVASFSFFLNYILWHEHGLMKQDMSDARVHLLQAQINLAISLAFAYGYYNPKSTLAYVAGFALVMLNGTWMFTAGLTACCYDMVPHVVGGSLAIQALLMGVLLVVGAACVPRVEERTKDAFEPLVQDDQEDNL